MKHFLTILCILTSFSALAQFPNTHTQSSPYTKEVFNGSTNPKKGLINGRYSDTAAANRDYVAGEKGIQIVVGNTIYMRDSTATKWIVAGGYGVTASNITILNDSSISICNGNSCDTFKFTNIVVNNFTVVNDSTILVCDGNNTCDTLFIPPTPIAKPYVDSVKVTGGDSLFYYITGKAYFGGLISPNSTSTISIYNDSTLVICNNNACDSFKTNIVISNFTVLNDSTVIVCPTSGSCDTVNINPTRFAKPYVDSTKIINGILFYYINGIGYSGGATSSFNGTSLVGGVVSYSGSGLTYNITPAYFTNPYFTDSTAAGQVTLSTADPTFSRIDAVVATKQGVDSVLTGVPSSNPELPQIDQTNEVLLTYIIVTAGETAPPVTVQTIYDQDTTGEWTPAASGLSANFASTANPYHSTKAIRISSWSNGNSITFSSPSPVSTNSYSVLTFYVYLASTLANNSNVTVQFYNGASVIGNTITLSSIYGFSKTKTGVYQPIAIPFSALGLTGNVNRMVVTFSKINSNAVDIDWIQFQSSGGTTGGGSGSGNYVTNIYRKSGTDSVFQIINNVASFAFIDSTGSSSGGTVTNFSFTNTTGITGTVTNPTTTPNLSLAIDTSALPGVHTTNFNDTRYALISTLVGNYVKYTDTASMLSPYMLKGTKNPLNVIKPILAVDSVTIGFDTMHLPELRYSFTLRDTTQWTDTTLIDRKFLDARINPVIASVNTNTTAIAGKQNTITLTTTGTSGAATLSGSTLNIPQYSGGGGGTIDTTSLSNRINKKQQNLGWVNVMDFSADSTGATDNSTAFANAIASLTTGGVLYVPHGNYLFTSNLSIDKTIRILGDGCAADANTGKGAVTRIICASNITVWSILAKVDIERIGFEWTGGSTATSGRAIYIKAAYKDSSIAFAPFTLTNISIKGFYDNLYIEGGASWTIDKCFFFDAVRYDTHIENVTNQDFGDWSIVNSYFIGGSTGIHTTGSGGGKITNCKFNSSWNTSYIGTAIYDSLGSGSVLTLINNCSFENFDKYALYVVSTNQVSVSSCEIANYHSITTPYVYFNKSVMVMSHNTFYGGNVNNTAYYIDSLCTGQVFGNNTDHFASATPYTIVPTTGIGLSAPGLTVFNLKTGLTAPITSGTVQMVTTDGNGLLSFKAIPNTDSVTTNAITFQKSGVKDTWIGDADVFTNIIGRNLYFDGSNYQRFSTTKYGFLSQMAGNTTTGYFQLYSAAPASNPVANLIKQFEVNNFGNAYVRNKLSIATTDTTRTLNVVGDASISSNLYIGKTSITGSATPTAIHSGGEYNNGAASNTGLKWFLFEDGNPIDSYGIGMASSLMYDWTGTGAARAVYVNNGTQASRTFPSGNTLLGIGTTDEGYTLRVNGQVKINTVSAGAATDSGLVISGGVIKSVARASGTATLVGGTVTVSSTAVTSGCKITLSVHTPGGTQGFLSTATRTAGTSFVINSTSATETSTVDWRIDP